MAEALVTHRGGCHCGAVAFTFEAPRDVTALDCNCSMCARAGFLHLVVPAARFTLERGQEALTEYRFNTGVARHLFCRVCGIKSFYVPRSNPDGYSVNLRCVAPGTLGEVTVAPFDGQRWEEHGDALAHLSRA